MVTTVIGQRAEHSQKTLKTHFSLFTAKTKTELQMLCNAIDKKFVVIETV